MKTLKHNSTNEWQKMLSLLFILYFVKVHSQKGSQFPLNDPRNPNCPCLQFQKLAEEEYKNLMAKGNTVQLKKTEKSSEKKWEHLQKKSDPVQQGISSLEKEQFQYLKNMDQRFMASNTISEEVLSHSSDHRSVKTSGPGNTSTKKHNLSGHKKWKRKKRNSHFLILTSKIEDRYKVLLKELRSVSRCYHWQ